MPKSFLDRLNQKCTICGAPISLRQFRFRRTCKKVNCIATYQRRCREAEKKQLALELKNQTERKATIDGAAARFLDGPVPDDLVTLPVPAFLKPLQPLSAQRRELFRVHLKQQIEEVFIDGKNPHVVPGELTDVTESKTVMPQTSSHVEKRPGGQIPSHAAEPNVFAQSACATCKGACCSDGDVKAYLDSDVIREYLRQNPGSDSDEILAQFVNRLPEHSYEESCVFHSASGCSLPRSMRSPVCNNFVCRSLVAINEHNGDQLFIVALDDQSRVIETRLVEKK